MLFHVKKNILIYSVILVFILGIFQILPVLGQVENTIVLLNFSPSVVDAGKNSYPFGYVHLVDNEGNPILASKDLTIKLTSSNPDIVSVPSEVIISVNKQYVKFNLDVSDIEGESQITATFQGQEIINLFRVGGVSVSVPLTVDLAIYAPSDKMNVQSQMPISVFFNNSGSVLQAPKDIQVFFDYDPDIIQLRQDSITIKKGDYFATNIIQTLGNKGNAFLKASTNEPELDTFSNINIFSSLPSQLKVTVLPDRLIQLFDREISFFVSVHDENGNPIKAIEDIPLEIFSNLVELDDELKESFKISKPIIRKGEWGFYHKEDRLIFNDITDRNFIGVGSPGFGLAEGLFSVLQELENTDIRAENQTIDILVIPTMPSDSTSVAVFQTVAIKGDSDDEEVIDSLVEDNTIPGHPFSETEGELSYEEGDTYPVASDFDNYDSFDLKGRILSSDSDIIRILHEGDVSPERAWGTILLKSGPLKTGTTTISAGITGVGKGSADITVVDFLAPKTIKFFSPSGENSIIFNNEGFTSIFLIAFDESNKPTISQSEIQFTIKPINDLVSIPQRSGFVEIKFESSDFREELEIGSAALTANPVGINVNDNLEVSNNFNIDPSSTIIQILSPVENLVGAEQIHDIGLVQLSDFFGNPVTVSTDLTVELISNNTEIIEVPEFLIIPAGVSFVEFDIQTHPIFDKVVSIDASTRGFGGSSILFKQKQFVKQLILFPVAPFDLQPGLYSDVQIFVDDENAVSVEGALLELFAGPNSTVIPESIETDETGGATVRFTTDAIGIATLDIFASKSGFTPDQFTMEMDVGGAIVEDDTIFGIPPLYLYAGVGVGAAGAAGVAVKILRKPKVMTEEEEEEEEI